MLRRSDGTLRRAAAWLVLLGGLVASLPAAAEPNAGSDVGAAVSNSSPARDGRRRPVVALVLGGGGARGAAHVGVIRVLERLGVPIDIIAGTSAGAIVGGLYAAGNTPDQIEEALRSTDWQAALDDRPPRSRRSQNARADERAMIAREVAGVSALEVKAPSALLQGQQFDFILRNLTLSASKVSDFDHLNVRFRAVATDAVNGEPVVLGSGDLARAIRASMAVPAVFAGVDIDGRLLIDGAVSNNLPISVAIEMGADVVIAVDISSPLRTREQLASLLGMMDQMTGFLTARNTTEQLGRLRPSDILLRPSVDSVSPSDFERARHVVEVGEQAADAQRSRLEALAESVRQASPVLQLVSSPDTAGVPALPIATRPWIRFVRFENASSIRDDMLRAKLGKLIDRPLDFEDLKLGLDRIYALEAFESVRYRVVEERGEAGLVISVVPRSWGRDALQFGLRMAAERHRGSEFDLGVAYEARAINDLNGKWRTEFQFGQTTTLATEIYQPLDPAEYWFVNARLGMTDSLRKLYRASDAISEYAITRTGLWLALGANVDRYGDIRAGIRRTQGHTRLSLGTNDPYPRYRFEEALVSLSAEFENLDSIRFPRSGMRLMVERIHALPQWGSTADYQQIHTKLTLAGSWREHTLIAQGDVGITTGGYAPIEARYTMGGLFSMPGYNIDALVGQHSVHGALTYLHAPGRVGLLPVYLGASLHVGNTWEDRGLIRAENLIKGRAVFVGTDTLIGPVYLGVGNSPGTGTALYLNLGQSAF